MTRPGSAPPQLKQLSRGMTLSKSSHQDAQHGLQGINSQLSRKFRAFDLFRPALSSYQLLARRIL
jgi:hypothetical protein